MEVEFIGLHLSQQPMAAPSCSQLLLMLPSRHAGHSLGGLDAIAPHLSAFAHFTNNGVNKEQAIAFLTFLLLYCPHKHCNMFPGYIIFY